MGATLSIVFFLIYIIIVILIGYLASRKETEEDIQEAKKSLFRQ